MIKRFFILLLAIVASVGMSWAAPAVAVNGKLPGAFSVGESTVVYFSQGNLQYTKSTGKWKIMDHQYDVVETLSQNVGTDYASQDVITLFGWGTSGWDNTEADATSVHYQPYSTCKTIHNSNANINNYQYGPSNANVVGSSKAASAESWSKSDSYKNYDWGVFNSGDLGSGWRVLTTQEWGYLLGSTSPARTNAANLRTLATVNSVPGLIIMPDGWTASGVSLTVTTSKYTTNNINLTNWSTLEEQGCVFLPAAGFREGTSVMSNVGTRGFYWSSSAYSANYAYVLRFYSGSFGPQEINGRYDGCSVRLVSETAPSGGSTPATGLQVTELQVPGSWADNPTMLSTSDMPGFSAVSYAEAVAWDAAPAGKVDLIFAFEDNAATALSFKNGVYQAAQAHNITYEDLYAWYSNGDKIFYTGGGSTYTVALQDGTVNADKVTLSATSAVEGATVTVTPNEEYEITAFSAYYVVVEDQLGSIYEIDATLNTETGAYSFTMPAYDVTIEATIAEKAAPAPAGTVTVVFEANNNQKEVEVTLPHTFACDFENGNGELDGIIQELYALQYGGYCQAFNVPTATGNAAVTASKDGNNHYIAISEAFEGTATVTGGYIKYLDTEHMGNTSVDYTLTISVQGSDPAPTPAGNLKLTEFQVPASWENDNSPITSADFPDFVATTYEIASALPVTSEPSLVVFDFSGDDEVSVYSKMGGQVSQPSTGSIKREVFFENTQVHYYYPVLAGGGSTPTVTWNSSNVSDLQVNGNSYSKEGITLSPNASNNYAYWLDYGNESQNGIYFYVNATGGHTFSNSLGKNFTKIEMTLNGSDGWYVAYLGSGWNIDGLKATWTGNASTVDLLTETSSFGGAAGVKSIVFYFEGGSEDPAPANSCGDGLTWELNGGVLTISYDGVGTGEMTDFDYEYDANPVNVAPWKENKSEITTVVIGDGVKSIGNYAFNDLYENFTAVTIANSVERIGLNAFMNAKWITEITLPSSLKTIDKECFAANFGFTSITIPSGVTSIGNKAFSYCNGLTSLTCEATTPPTLASSVFYKVRSKTSDMSNIPLYVPSESVAAYEAAAQWNAFDVQAITGGGSTPANSCGDGLTWELKNGELTISYTGTGTGVMDNYASASDAPWYSHKDDITSVTITDGVKSVGSYSFGYYGNLVTVTIGNDVETIGEYAFGDCYKFTTLNLGNSVKHIGNRAFMWAKVLTGFTLPSTLETIGERAFLQNKVITSLTIPSSVTSIGQSAFMYCAALTSVTVEATTPPTLGATVFDGVPTASIPLHVPNGSVAAYTAADQWKDFDIQDPTPAYEKAINLINAIGTVELTAECKAKIDAARAAFIALSDGDKDLVTNIATLTTAEAAFDNVMDIWLSGDCDAILWKDTTLTIRKHAGEGNGAMADYNYASRAPWYSSHWYDPKPNDIVIKSVTIEEGVTHLGDYAFAWMSETKTVTIPSSVTTIPEDAFYWSKAVDDIYLNTNPSDLMWVLPTSADNQFKPEKGTNAHVPVDLLPYYQEWLNTLNVTYVGDQTPTVPTVEVGKVFNDSDEVYIGPDTTYIQFNCSSAEKYMYAKGTFKIMGDEFVPGEVFGIKFEPKSMSYCFMKFYSNGKTVVAYGTSCCATAKPTQMTVVSGDGTKANPFIIEPDTKGECVQAEMTTLPQAVSEITYDGEPHTLIAAGVSTAGTVQYSIDNGASWSADLPQGINPVTYTIHYRVIGGDPCIQGIDYDPNNKVTASIVSPAVKAVTDKIAAIPQPVVYTPACNDAIAEARSAYDALDDDLKPFVENYDVLTAAETTYANLKDVAVVEAKINAIPTTIELKLATRDSIQNARAAYDALTDDQQALVSNYDVLEAAEAALAALNPGGSAPVDIVWDGNTGIADVDPNTTSPAYEGMTVTVGNGSSFSTYQNRLYFTFYSQPNGGYIFANENGTNITKVVIESTTALTSTMKEVDRMGSGWVISNENKTATWTGNADSVSIWKGQSFTNYWVVDVITFTVNGVGATPLDSAQIVKDLIEAIPVPVTLDSKDEIDAARDAYDALADLTKGALDNATVKKLTDAEDAYAALIKEATDVIALINAIPQPVVYNEACGDSIAAARNAYDALSDELKPLVTNYPVLTDAEATYEALAPRIWTSGDCQVIYWPGDSAMIVSKLPGEGNGVMDNYANKNSVPWVDYQLKVKTLTIESGVTEIGSCAFYELRNLEGGLVIPEGVTAIHENGFRNSLKLTSITLPSTITLLGDNADAFNNCKAANISITADPNKLAWNEDFDDFIYSYSQQDVHKTTVCHVPVDFYEIYVAKFDQTVNVTFVGDLPAALSPAEHAAIEAVKDSIAAIGAEISYPESGAAIDAARSAYDALDDDLKPFVSNYQTLLDAEDAYADAKQAHDAVAAAVVDKINAIPVPVEYSSKAAIDTARVAYDALFITQKALVPDSILQKLTNAEQAWAAIAAKVEHNVSYIGKDGELKNEKVALLHIPDPAPEFNGYEFVRWDVKAGDFLEEGLRIKAIYTPIITTNPQGFDTLAYNGLAQELVKAGVAKEGHIEYSLYPEEPESWSTELPKATIAGVYAIYYKLVREGHADYIAPEPTMATIAKVPVTYVAPTAVESLVYTAANQTLIAAGQTQDGTFEYSLAPTLLDSWKTALPQAMSAGTYSVYYRVQGDLNHLDSVATDPIAVTIAKEELTATADDKNVIYGDAVPAYTVTYAGWQGDDDATVLTGDIAFACEYASTSNVGEYTITPSGVSAANYDITFVNGKVTVAKAESGCIAPVVYDTLVYNGANQTLIIAGQPMGGEMQYSLDTTVLDCWSTSLPQAKDAGTYNVYYRVKGDMNHNDHYYDLITVSIAKAALTATAENKTVTYGNAAPEYTVVYAGWHGTDDASVLTGTIAFACTYTPTSNVGDYTITPSGVDAANYIITFVKGKVTVVKAPLMITADDKNVIYGEVAPAFTASYEGWKNSDDESVVSGLTLTSEYLVTSNVGTYDIVPANASATNYAISYTNGTLTVAKAALTITANDTTMIYGDEHPEFTASYSGWKNSDDESVVSGLQFSTPYAPGSYIGTYAINPNSATAQNYAITFVDGTLTVNKAVVKVANAEAQIAKFEDGTKDAVVLNAGTLEGIKLSDPIAHKTTAEFNDPTVAEQKTITLFYELTGDAALLNNYDLQPTSEIFTTEGVIIEKFIPDDDHQPEAGEQVEVKEGIDVYAYGYCDGSGYSLKYHLNSGNPDQYKIDFADSRFTDVDWTNLVTAGKDGTIDIEIPVDMPTGDYNMTVYFRDSRFTWLESRALTVTFHVNLPETYVKPMFDNTIVLIDTCECFTDIQWYHRNNSSEPWQPIEGATGHYYRPADGSKLTGEYFVSAKMNGMPTYTCGQEDMETLYGADKAKAAKVSAYPNPVVTTTTVTIEGADNYEHTLRIVDLMGNEVENSRFEGNTTTVDMNGYMIGNYLISVDGIVVKVMKQ